MLRCAAQAQHELQVQIQAHTSYIQTLAAQLSKPRGREPGAGGSGVAAAAARGLKRPQARPAETLDARERLRRPRQSAPGQLQQQLSATPLPLSPLPPGGGGASHRQLPWAGPQPQPQPLPLPAAFFPAAAARPAQVVLAGSWAQPQPQVSSQRGMLVDRMCVERCWHLLATDHAGGCRRPSGY